MYGRASRRLLLIVAMLPAFGFAAAIGTEEFSQARAMAHIRFLAALKNRAAGTLGESRAIHYVAKNLRDLGLDVHAEPFLFSSLDLNSAVLHMGEVAVRPASIIFDPYRGAMRIGGDVAFVTAFTLNGEPAGSRLDLAHRIVVTTKDAPVHRIAVRQPAAILRVTDQDFDKLSATQAGRAELVLNGRVQTLRSANLVATTRGRAPGIQEILLSAHIDSAGTPGAQDNASGVAVLLELARWFAKRDLPVRLRFVFFGAEEVGLLGSKAYVDRHRQDLQRCGLMFNMDSIGGRDIWIDMRDGVQDLPKLTGLRPRPLDLQATGDPRGRWALLASDVPASEASNVPPWLQTAIRKSVRQLGYELNEGRGASSDHRTFSEAGVVATNIAIGGIKSHSPEDTPDQIDPFSLEKAARIVTGVVTRSIAVFASP